MNQIAGAVECGTSTVYRVRQAFVEEGLPAALFRKKPTGRQYRKLDGAQEAHLIALGLWRAPRGRAAAGPCGCWPTARSNWTVVDAISPECVRTTLKKTNSSRGRASSG